MDARMEAAALRRELERQVKGSDHLYKASVE
jgi:hypothetical protein